VSGLPGKLGTLGLDLIQIHEIKILKYCLCRKLQKKDRKVERLNIGNKITQFSNPFIINRF